MASPGGCIECSDPAGRARCARHGANVLPARSRRPIPTPLDACRGPHVVERKDGKAGSRRALRARAGTGGGRRGRPVLQQPVLGAADGERRNRPSVRGVRLEVPEASMSAAAASASPSFAPATTARSGARAYPRSCAPLDIEGHRVVGAHASCTCSRCPHSASMAAARSARVVTICVGKSRSRR